MAITNHAPMDFGHDLDEIQAYLTERADDLVAIFQRRKLRPLEFDEVGPLIAQLQRRLIGFAFDCNALPLRTPRQLIPTVKAIAKDPATFLARVGEYDPEAVARIYGAYAGDSEERRKILEDFEWGKGDPPPVEAIVLAAKKVLADLEAEKRKTSHQGGQTLVLQNALILDLARIFENHGGRLSRNTRFVAQKLPESVEDGPFHDFLGIVVPPVRASAERAGFRMRSIRSLAGIPRRFGYSSKGQS